MRENRIIFLDDDPKTGQRLKRSLEEKGFKIVEPQDMNEASLEVIHNGAELFIHVAHKSKTYWSLCEDFFKHFPQFSSIHFASGPESEEYLKKMKGPFHHRMRHLMPEKEFLKKVRKLIFFNRIRRENLLLKKTLELNQQSEKLFSTLDLETLKKEFVEFFKTQSKGENAFFLVPGYYGYLIKEGWNVTPIQAHGDKIKKQKYSVVSAVPCDEQELADIFQTATDFLPTGWELHKNKLFIKRQGQMKCSAWILPIIGHESGRIFGHILITNPIFDKESVMMNALPHMMKVLGRHFEHVNSFSDAKSLSYIDDLTDLYNQRYLRLILDKEIDRCQRTNSCFSVLFMDIDHFKRVNDSRGHLVGSKLLVALSKILHANIRTSDYGFRYGGDEFLLVLVGTGSETALTVAERIRKRVEEATFDIEGVKIKMTLSVGIATYPDHASSRDQIIEIADKAMYSGKSKSRNIVYVAS